jgi:hypothetical protein
MTNPNSVETAPPLYAWAFEETDPLDPWAHPIFITRSARTYALSANVVLPNGSLRGPDVATANGAEIVVGEDGVTQECVDGHVKAGRARRVEVETWRWLASTYVSHGDPVIEGAYGRLLLATSSMRRSIDNPHGRIVGTREELNMCAYVYEAEFICKGILESGRHLAPCPPSVARQKLARKHNTTVFF